MEKVSDALSEAMCLGGKAIDAVNHFVNAIDKIAKINSPFFVEQDRIELIKYSVFTGTCTDDIYAAMSHLAELHENITWLEERENK